MKAFMLIIFTAVLSCQSQTTNLNEFANDDYELINIFLNNTGNYIYLNKYIINNKNNFNSFKDEYIKQLKFYKSAEDFCERSKDTLEIKFYCPIAEDLKKYNDLFLETDFEYLQNKISNENKSELLNFEKIENKTLLNHSLEYYKNSNSTVVNEFPSIAINGVYYTKNGQMAVLVFTFHESYSNGNLNYFIFKKEKNIWWKPIGKLKLF